MSEQKQEKIELPMNMDRNALELAEYIHGMVRTYNKAIELIQKLSEDNKKMKEEIESMKAGVINNG